MANLKVCITPRSSSMGLYDVFINYPTTSGKGYCPVFCKEADLNFAKEVASNCNFSLRTFKSIVFFDPGTHVFGNDGENSVISGLNEASFKEVSALTLIIMDALYSINPHFLIEFVIGNEHIGCDVSQNRLAKYSILSKLK